jgi:hypothetical protein
MKILKTSKSYSKAYFRLKRCININEDDLFVRMIHILFIIVERKMHKHKNIFENDLAYEKVNDKNTFYQVNNDQSNRTKTKWKKNRDEIYL